MTEATPLDERTRRIVEEVREGLRRLYGTALHGLLVYGSYARRTAQAESDLDLLVVLENVEDVGQELARVSDLGSRLSLAHDLTISLLPVSEWEFRHLHTPLMLNVRREAIPV